MIKNLLLASTAFAVAALAVPATAATVLINFDNVPSGSAVDAFYSGEGVTFSDFVATGGFGETSAPNLAYSATGNGVATTTFGFTSLSFTAGFFSTGTLDVYSGSGGTGTLLGTLSGTLGDPFAFAPYSVAFAGTAHSFTLTGGAGELGLDDVAFGTTTTVPEPASWALLVGGFGLIGATLRRRVHVAA